MSGLKKTPMFPLMLDLVRSGLSAMDGVVFTERQCCPYCGGPLLVHDYKDRKFATLLQGSDQMDIMVSVRRFHCRSCHRLVTAEVPFYPDVHLGSPVVDLCIVLTHQLPYSQADRLIRDLGVVLHRGTIRNYATLPIMPAVTDNLFGITFPRSLLNLSSLAAARSAGEPITGEDALAACMSVDLSNQEVIRSLSK
ncbi:transposase family protein [Methanosphaerula palustris]|nr:transposase family protein [Methanosphaerula palustris]